MRLLNLYELHLLRNKKHICAKKRGNTLTVYIRSGLSVYLANPLKADEVELPDHKHVAEYKRRLVKAIRQIGIVCKVSVCSKTMDNVRVKLSLPNIRATPTQVKEALIATFCNAIGHEVHIKVNGA